MFKRMSKLSIGRLGVLMKVVFVILFALLSALSNAQVMVSPRAVPQNLHIFNESGNAYVVLAESGCSGSTYYIPADHPKYNAIISILMAAQLSNKEVVARFDGCNSNGQGRLVGVYLK